MPSAAVLLLLLHTYSKKIRFINCLMVCKALVDGLTLFFPILQGVSALEIGTGGNLKKRLIIRILWYAMFLLMQIRLLQAQAVEVNGDREGKLREASYRCYKPFLEDSFYLFNYSMKEMEHKYELICKTFGRKSIFFFSFSAVKYCSLKNGYHT